VLTEKERIMNRRRLIILAAGGWAGLQAVRGVAGSADVEMHSLLGKRAPDFAAVDTQGRKRQLSEFKGKPVVLEWTSPSCPFVKAQYQSGVMQEAQKMAAAKGAAWLTILSTHPTRRDYLAADKAEAFNRNRGGAPTALLLDQGRSGRSGCGSKDRSAREQSVWMHDRLQRPSVKTQSFPRLLAS
jgi:hypothetical protein